MGRSKDFVLGTAGHIDHGKTALVRALTGVDTDRLPDEKLRGITIDLGFAALDLGPRHIAVVDVPGHERFIRNMLAGATGFDLAMLVIAVDDSVMPQTREHLDILRLLKIRSGLVALTKCDLADDTWVAMVEEEARSLLVGTFLEGCPIVRTSVTTGRGIGELKEILAQVCDAVPSRPDPGPFRLAVDRAFTIPGHGTVVSGTVASGTASIGDELQWLPAGKPVRIRGLHQHDRAVESVGAGSRAAINLAGVRHTEVSRGDELAEPGYLSPSRVLSVQIEGMTHISRPLRHRARYRLHLGTAEVTATLSLLDREPASLPGPALAQLLLPSPVAAVYGQPFVLREESPAITVGGGRVLEPMGRRLRRRDVAAIARLGRLRSADPIERAGAALAGIGLGQWTERSLCRDTGIPRGEIPDVLDRLRASGVIVDIPLGPRRTARVVADLIADLEDRLLRALVRLHEASPRMSAIPRNRLVGSMAYLGDDPLVEGLIGRLKGRGALLADARAVALPDHQPRLSQGERKLKAEIAEAYRVGGMKPPEPAEWMAKSNPRAAAVPELLTLLCEEERIVLVAPGLYLDADVTAEVRRRVSERLADGSTLSMSELRDFLGTTRKYAVPIGEYLDRIGLTDREGDVRRLRHAQPAAGASMP